MLKNIGFYLLAPGMSLTNEKKVLGLSPICIKTIVSIIIQIIFFSVQ